MNTQRSSSLFLKRIRTRYFNLIIKLCNRSTLTSIVNQNFDCLTFRLNYHIEKEIHWQFRKQKSKQKQGGHLKITDLKLTEGIVAIWDHLCWYSIVFPGLLIVQRSWTPDYGTEKWESRREKRGGSRRSRLQSVNSCLQSLRRRSDGCLTFNCYVERRDVCIDRQMYAIR